MRCFSAASDSLPAVLLAAPALVVHLLPRGAGEALVYDRSAIVAGQCWRLVTGHWVHFSASHLFWDTLVVGVAAWIAARRGYRSFPLLCLIAGLAISLGLLALLPGLERYGGLSGIAMAATCSLAVRGLGETRPWRYFWAWVLLASAVKLGGDVWAGSSPFGRFADAGIRLVPLSHVIGAAFGAAAGAWSLAFAARGRPPARTS